MRGIKSRESAKWKQVAIFCGLLLVFGLLSNSAYKVYQKRQEAEKTLAHMQEQMSELEDRNKNLKNNLEKLGTKEGIEFEIRRKLNVAQVGESVAVIVDSQTVSSTSTQTFSSWQKFKNSLVNFFR